MYLLLGWSVLVLIGLFLYVHTKIMKDRKKNELRYNESVLFKAYH